MEAVKVKGIKFESLKKLGIHDKNFGSSSGIGWSGTKEEGEINITSPVDGNYIASVYQASETDYVNIVKRAEEAFKL